MEMQPVTVGIVGSGNISETYLNNLTKKFSIIRVVAIADLAIEKAQIQARKFHLRACTVDELMSDSSVEAILNLTPAAVHYGIIKRALLAGKHVYTEKSLTDSYETAKELTDLAKEKGLYLGSAPDTFFCSWLQRAREAIDSGMLGEITSFAIAGNRDNDMLLSLFGFLRKPGSGLAADYAVYYLTALVHLLGPIGKVMAQVKAPYPDRVNILEGPEYGQPIHSDNDSQVFALIETENGVSGTLHINGESCFFDRSYFAIYGKKGVLYLSNPDWFNGTVSFMPNGYDHSHHPEPKEMDDSYAFKEDCRGVGMADMAWAIREGRENRASGRLASHVLDVVECMHRSHQTETFCQVESTCERPRPLKKPKDTEESSLTTK